MAATIAYAVGYKRDGSRQASQASRLGHGSAMANANTWHTFTTCHVNADGSGFVTVVRDGKTIHHHAFGPEGVILFSEEAARCAECAASGFTARYYVNASPTDKRIEDMTEAERAESVIQSPGKFEGEPLATYHAYHTMLNGCADDEDGSDFRVGNVVCHEREDGLVDGSIFDSEEEAARAWADASDGDTA